MQSYYVKNPIGRVRLTNTRAARSRTCRCRSCRPVSWTPPRSARARPGDQGRREPRGAAARLVQRAGVHDQRRHPPHRRGDRDLQHQGATRGAAGERDLRPAGQDGDHLGRRQEGRAPSSPPADSALQNYVSFVRQSLKDATLGQYNEALQLAMQVYGGLAEIGVLYQADPVSPFTKVQGNTVMVDSVKLPRDTLKRGTGDCDDLTVLFCSLLESAGVETGFITVPGHIYAAVNTGTRIAAGTGSCYPDRGLLIDVDGSLWVPVEITMIGRNDFLAAWRQGSRPLANLRKDPCQAEASIARASRRRLQTRGPARVRPRPSVRQAREHRAALPGRHVEAFRGRSRRSYAAETRRTGAKEDNNRLGPRLRAVRPLRRGGTGVHQGAPRSTGATSRPRVNLGNIAYLQTRLRRRRARVPGRPRHAQAARPGAVTDSRGRAAEPVQGFVRARALSRRAGLLLAGKAAQPDTVREFAYLGSDAGSRAADVGAAGKLLFVDEEN